MVFDSELYTHVIKIMLSEKIEKKIYYNYYQNKVARVFLLHCLF